MEHNPYISRIFKAVTFIETHLNDALAVEQVAAVSGLSMYHFHRMFSAMTGEPVMAYIRRRRLTRAAWMLIESDARIIDVALDAQFQSQQAFTRAFKQAFRVPPGVFRARGIPAPILERPPLTLDELRHLADGGMMEPYFVEYNSDLCVAGFLGVFPHGDTTGIPALWAQLEPHIHQLRNTANDLAYGVCLASTPDSEGALTYMASVAVNADQELPDGMEKTVLKAGNYAVFTHKGHISKIGESVRFIWGTWLPRSEYEVGDGPDFELYDERFDPMTGQGEVDIYLPVVKKD